MLVWLLFGIAFSVVILEKSDVGKNPNDEKVTFTQETNKVTGELLNVQIVRCKICGEIVSFARFSLNGKPRHVFRNYHRCGQYQNTVKFQGSGFGPLKFRLTEWLDKWQKRLAIRH